MGFRSPKSLGGAAVGLCLKAKAGGGYEVVISNRHLPESSPICLPHQVQMRLKSIEHMHRVTAHRRYHVSVTFTANEETKNEIQRQFLEFLRQAESLVKEATEVEPYQLNFDLFPWQLTSISD